MSNEIPLLNDAELEAVSGGMLNTSLDGASRLDGTPPATTLSRVKTSDKQQAAVLAFVKG